jgi:general secretion pathway protein C
VPRLSLAQVSGEVDQGAQTETVLILEGVIVSSEPASSVALVRRPQATRARSVRVGETVYGMTLIEVSEETALFDRGGKQHLLHLDGGRTLPSAHLAENPAGMKTSTREAEDSTPPENVASEKEAWLRRELERSVTEERLTKEMTVILAETGIRPRAEEGDSQGIQITHLPDGTLLSELGLLPGDVLLSVNDVPLKTMSSLTRLLPGLRSESEIRILVERQGHILKLAYDIH